MYSWELDNYFRTVNYYFSTFYEFEKIRRRSPQLKYSLGYSNDDETCLNVFSDDGHSWQIHIKKEDKHNVIR